MWIRMAPPSSSPRGPRFAAALLAPSVMLLCLAAGCSSTAMPVPDGAAGATGSAGTTGAGGNGAGGGGGGGGGGGDTCAALGVAYDAAYQRAITCSPFVNSVQCAQLASPSLPCPSCMLHVNDTTELDQIRAQYDTAHCPPVPCPAIACILPGTGTCVANDGGATGTCKSLYPQ